MVTVQRLSSPATEVAATTSAGYRVGEGNAFAYPRFGMKVRFQTSKQAIPEQLRKMGNYKLNSELSFSGFFMGNSLVGSTPLALLAGLFFYAA